MEEKITKTYFRSPDAKVLVIGHDPRLQTSNTQAEYAFFADYFFKPKSSDRREHAKYELAEALYTYINWLTDNKYNIDDFIITNLCNHHLPKAPTGKTVFIPEDKAKEGLENIKQILKEFKIKFILATSQQVNYWLQKLGFYNSENDFLIKSEPKENGVRDNYYEAVQSRAFLDICGREYLADGIPLFPVLHIKQYPLRSRIKANYEKLLLNCINEIKKL
jgi:hypothetical protein